MKITPNVIQLITNALRVKEPRLTQEALAEELGKSKSWVSKLLRGTIQNLDEDDAEKIEDILGIKLQVMSLGFSGLAAQVDEATQGNNNLAKAIMAMLEVADNPARYEMPYIPTEDLVAFGAEMIRAAHENPDKAGKVGRIGIVWLSQCLERLNTSKSLEEGAPKTIPMLGCVAAGSGVYVYEVRETIAAKKTLSDDHFALQVCGDSMDDGSKKAIPDGATIVVKRLPEGTEPKSGKIYIVSDDNGSMLKIYKGKKLGSLNPKYDDFEPMDGAIIQAEFVEVIS